jgi:hypothetical protein
MVQREADVELAGGVHWRLVIAIAPWWRSRRSREEKRGCSMSLLHTHTNE